MQKTEKARDSAIFSRDKDSGSKLFFSLKNLFYRTEKSSANAAVTTAVPEMKTESIKSDVKKLARPEPDLRSRVRHVYRQLLNQSQSLQGQQPRRASHEVTVSHFDTALHKLFDGKKLFDGESKKLFKELGNIKAFVEQNEEMSESNKRQLLKDLDLLIKMATNDKEKKPDKKDAEKIHIMQSFKNDFDSNFKSMIAEIPGMNEQSADVKIIREAIIRTANAGLSTQIINDPYNLKKENFKKEFEATLKLQFNNNISSDLLTQITNAVSISFDIAEAEKLKK